MKLSLAPAHVALTLLGASAPTACSSSYDEPPQHPNVIGTTDVVTRYTYDAGSVDLNSKPVVGSSDSEAALRDAGSASGPVAITSSSTSAAGSYTAPSDGAIAQIVDDANSGEIEQAKYAILHAKSAAVKHFAEHMVSAHEDFGHKMKALVKSQDIVPSPSDDSNDIRTDGSKTLVTLRQNVGDDFDKVYIAAQIREHQDLLDKLNGKLIPGAQNSKLRDKLEALRPVVADHLKQAREIQMNAPH